MNDNDAVTFIDQAWDDVLGVLTDYIRIPAVSPMFSPTWAALGHIDRAVDLLRDWAESCPIDGMTVEVVRLPGRTPVILCEVPPAGDGADEPPVLLYGHLDKQPEMTGWRDGLGPWEPVFEDDRLYGRGGADDGYAIFCALSAIQAVRIGGGSHARCVVLIEASEESGSPDMPAYVDALADRLGQPGLVVTLDSGTGDYERLWVTTSLRGLVGVDLTVEILTEGVHSGKAGGIVPSSFRLLRLLLSRVEDESTGEILLPDLHADIPADRAAQMKIAGSLLGDLVSGEFPFVDGAVPMSPDDPVAQLLDRAWRPTLEVVGIDGSPPTGNAGNVLRPFTRAKLSFRLPPTVDPDRAAAAVRAALTHDPPSGAVVTAQVTDQGPGFSAPPTAPWLEAVLDEASGAAFGQPAAFLGEGGSIPFMGMLGARFPEAQFVVTGELGPHSNAHGPNEFLHLPTVRRLTEVVARVLDAHAHAHARAHAHAGRARP
ncbi:MAG: M20/M25/M40 family metallo-hydrolase [Acidimicrobiales bacterium]